MLVQRCVQLFNANQAFDCVLLMSRPPMVLWFAQKIYTKSQFKLLCHLSVLSDFGIDMFTFTLPGVHPW